VVPVRTSDRPATPTKRTTEHLSKHVVRVEPWRHSRVHGAVWVSKLIEILAFLRIAKNVIGPLYFLELLWVSTLVWMVLEDELTIRLFELVFIGAFLNP
jgi:hypothetical protein